MLGYDFNLVNFIFFVFYIVFEIFFNIVCKVVGFGYWFFGLIIVFGGLIVVVGFVNNYD